MGTIIYLLLAFIITNLAVGLYYSRGVESFKAYAVGDGKMHPWLLAATIAATWATGSGFSVVLKKGFVYNVHEVMVVVFLALSLVFVSFFVLRMGEFYGSTSIAGVMRRLYGRRISLIVAITAFLCCIGKLASQLRVFSDVVANVLGLDPTTMLLTLSTLVILYSVWGGLRSIVFTNVLQFGIVGVALPVVIYMLYGYVQDGATTISYVPGGNGFAVDTLSQDVFHDLFNGFGLYSYFLMMGFVPPLVQRCLVNRNLLQTRKAFQRATLGYAYIVILGLFLGRMLAASPADLDSGDLLTSMIKKYSYTGFKTLIAFVIMAMALSSADSYINTSAVLLADISKIKSLLAVRIFGGMTGMLSIGLVFLTPNTSVGALARISFLFYSPVVPVFLLALLGFRTSQRTALLAMGGSILVTLGLKFGDIYSLSTAISAGALANVLLMFALHYGLGEPGGWVGIKDKAPLIAYTQLRKRRWASRWSSMKSFDLLPYLKRNLPRKEGHYLFFGFYVLTFVFGSGFFLPIEIIQEERMVWVLGSFLLLNSITMTYPIWPQEIKKRWIIAPFWALHVGYALCYIGMLWLLLGGLHAAHVALLAVNLMLAILLMRRKLLMTWMAGGSLMAILTCRAMEYPIIPSASMKLSFVVLIVFAGLYVLYLSQQKRRRLVQLYLTLGSLQRSTEEALASLRLAPDHFAKQLVETNHAGVNAAYQMSKAELGVQHPLTQKISTSAQYLAKTVELIQTETRLKQRFYPLSKFLNKLYERYDLDEEGLILYNRARPTTIRWDIDKMHQLLHKTYRYLKRSRPEGDYSYLHVGRTLLKYPSIKKPIPAVAFVFAFHIHPPHIAASYTHTERLEDPYLFGNRLLQEVHALTDKHCGYLDLTYTSQSALMVLPVRLDKARPKVIEDEKAPQKALEGDLLREARFVEGDFWVRVTQQPHYNIPEIEQVVHFMKAAHQHQARKNNAPYYTHTLTVAKYVSEYDLRPHLLIAALLHDVVEDTHVTLEEVRIRFGDEVAQLVKLLSNIDLDTFKKYRDTDKAVHRAWLAQNRDAILIKACERVHNLETLHAMPRFKQQAKAQETFDYYVPVVENADFPDLAHRLSEMSKRFLWSLK